MLVARATTSPMRVRGLASIVPGCVSCRPTFCPEAVSSDPRWGLEGEVGDRRTPLQPFVDFSAETPNYSIEPQSKMGSEQLGTPAEQLLAGSGRQRQTSAPSTSRAQVEAPASQSI